MAEGRSRAQWNHTSHLMAMTANVNRDPAKKPSPYQPGDFNPFRERHPRREKPTATIGVRQLFDVIKAPTSAASAKASAAGRPRPQAQGGGG